MATFDGQTGSRSTANRNRATSECGINHLVGEEVEELGGDGLGCVLDEEMRCVFHGAAADLGRVGAPQLERIVVEAWQGPGTAPQREDRTADRPLPAVGVVELSVDRRAGAIVLAH